MKKKNCIKICSTALFALTFLLPISISSAYTGYDHSIEESSGISAESSYSIQSTQYEYRYAMRNGHLYKRLYNTRAKQWAGDWILVK